MAAWKIAKWKREKKRKLMVMIILGKGGRHDDRLL